MGIMLRWKIFNYMLDIDIIRNYSPKDLGVLRGDFWSFGCLEDALQVKTMIWSPLYHFVSVQVP